MPKIVSANANPAISTALRAGYYRLIGLEIAVPPSVKTSWAIVRLGRGGPEQTTLDAVDRFVRTTDEVLDDMARRARNEDRPQPQHKRVWAEMTRILEGEPVSGREWLFCSLAVECKQRDPQGKKTLICLLDGERSLWDMQRFWFGRAIGILDIFHVSERIWGVAHCFHAEKSERA